MATYDDDERIHQDGKKITTQQQLFCREYLKDHDAKKAGLRAGYSHSTATQLCPKWVNSDKSKCPARYYHVWEYIRAETKRLVAESKIDAIYVLNQIQEIHEMDVADILDDDCNILPIPKWPIIWRRMISGIKISEVKNSKGVVESIIKDFKWPDKIKNLELMGKHANVNAFLEKVEIKTSEELTPWSNVTASVDKLDDKVKH